MRRKFIMVIAMVLVLSVPVSAAVRYTIIVTSTATLQFDETTAKCNLTVRGSPDVESITAKVTLYYVNNNGGLSISKSWPSETVVGNYYRFSEYANNRVSGRTYVLEAVVTATDSDGTEETITLTDEAVC